MNTYISMLRGINVSGHKKIKMAELRAMVESLGFANVQSYVQSGNVVFDSDETDRAALAATIEAGIVETFGFQVALFIRDASDFRRIIDGNPFAARENVNPARLQVTFLNEPVSDATLSTLIVPDDSNDEYVAAGSEIYLFCPDGIGRSKLAAAVTGSKLLMPNTTRNWNTINALDAMATRG